MATKRGVIKVRGAREDDADSAIEAESAEPVRSDGALIAKAPPFAATAIIFSAAVVAVFWLIDSDGVDMVRADQWYDIRLIHDSSAGTLNFTTLWAQHAENRMLFQNLLTIFLGHTTHYNVLVEDYLSAVLLIMAVALLIWTHRSRSSSTPWIAYTPVAILMLSVVQWGIVLFGFEIGWAMIMLALAVALYLLDRPDLGNLPLAIAIAAAVVASFTSLQGLLIWPAALALLYQRRRPRAQVAIWIASAVITTVLYFLNWNSVESGNSTSYVFAHPLSAIEFFFVAIGDVVGIPINGASPSGDFLVGLLGAVIVVSAVSTLLLCGLRRDESSGSPVGCSLIWFGLLFAAMITGARASIGLSAAGASRYTTFDLLILVGTYLALVGRIRTTVIASWTGRVLGVVVIGAICLQVILGTSEGISSATAYHQFELTGADITANINHAPDGLVESWLGGGDEPASFIRRMTRVAMDQHLSLFSTSAVTGYVRAGLPIDKSPPSTGILRPTKGAVLKGVQWLVAAANATFGIARVEFELKGIDRPNTIISMVARTSFGWLGAWDTSTVPNGTYTLSCVATDSSGLTTTSAGVVVTVRN